MTLSFTAMSGTWRRVSGAKKKKGFIFLKIAFSYLYHLFISCDPAVASVTLRDAERSHAREKEPFEPL